MIERFFHSWERRLAAVDTNRVVRPFSWGLDWIGLPASPDPADDLVRWSRNTLEDSATFFTGPSSHRYEFDGSQLRFPSAVVTPDAANNTVHARVFHPQPTEARRPSRAIVVLPQWNSSPDGHVGLCELFARFGFTAVRLSLPYHDARRPPELVRSEHIVSANIGQTLHVNRQAVSDTIGVVDWLAGEGFERIGIVGTSLGSCLAMLAMAHEPRIVVGAFNHVSPYFADVVWRGLSTRHVKEGLEGHVSLDLLRTCWMPISPWPYISLINDRPTLLLYARYDLTFPVDLSKRFIAEFTRLGVRHDTTVLPCGHYTTGKAPFKYLDGYALTKFFVKRL